MNAYLDDLTEIVFIAATGGEVTSYYNKVKGLVENEFDDCWSACGEKAGPCDWCGTGLCCKQGDDGCGDESLGGANSYLCTKPTDEQIKAMYLSFSKSLSQYTGRLPDYWSCKVPGSAVYDNLARAAQACHELDYCQYVFRPAQNWALKSGGYTAWKFYLMSNNCNICPVPGFAHGNKIFYFDIKVNTVTET